MADAASWKKNVLPWKRSILKVKWEMNPAGEQGWNQTVWSVKTSLRLRHLTNVGSPSVALWSIQKVELFSSAYQCARRKACDKASKQQMKTTPVPFAIFRHIWKSYITKTICSERDGCKQWHANAALYVYSPSSSNFPFWMTNTVYCPLLIWRVISFYTSQNVHAVVL